MHFCIYYKKPNRREVKIKKKKEKITWSFKADQRTNSLLGVWSALHRPDHLLITSRKFFYFSSYATRTEKSFKLKSMQEIKPTFHFHVSKPLLGRGFLYNVNLKTKQFHFYFSNRSNRNKKKNQFFSIE